MVNASRIPWSGVLPKELQKILPERCYIPHPQLGRLKYRCEYRILNFKSLSSQANPSSFHCDADLLVRLVLDDDRGCVNKIDSSLLISHLDVHRFIDYTKLHCGIPITVCNQAMVLRVAGSQTYQALAAIVTSKTSLVPSSEPNFKMVVRSWGMPRPYYCLSQSSSRLCSICYLQGHRYITCCEKAGLCRVTFTRLTIHEDKDDLQDCINMMRLPIEPVLPDKNVFLDLYADIGTA